MTPPSGKSGARTHPTSGPATGEASSSPRDRGSLRPDFKDPELRRLYERCLAGLRNDPPIDDAFMEEIGAWPGTPAEYRELVLALLDEEDVPLQDRINMIDNLMFPMSSAHPLEALEMMDTLSAHLGMEGKMHHLTVNLVGFAAQKDPQYAFDWLQAHAARMEPGMLELSSMALLTHTATRDPATALSFAGQLPGDMRGDAITSIGRGIQGAGSRTAFWQQAREMASSLPPQAAEELRSAALAGLANSLSGEHFHPGGVYQSPISGDEAIHWLESAELSPADLGAVCRNLPIFGSAGDTRHVLDWITSQLSESDLEGNLTAFMSSWAVRQPTGVEQWLRENPSSPGFQENATIFLAAEGTRDPEAFDRIAGLFPDDQRESAMAAIRSQISRQQNDTHVLLENSQQGLQAALRQQEEAYEKARNLRNQQH